MLLRLFVPSKLLLDHRIICSNRFEYKHAASDQDMYYQVTVENWKTQNSPTVGVASETLFAITAGAPTPARNVRKTYVNRTEITLAWDEALNDGGSEVLQYYVYKNDGLGGTEYVSAVGASDPIITTQTLTVTGLTTGLYYGFKVAAVNRVVLNNPGTDSGPRWSNPFYAFLAVTPSQPDPPQYVDGSRTVTGVTLKWTAPSDNGGQLLTGYRLYRDDGVTANPNIIIWNGEGKVHVKEFAVTGLSPGSSYVFGVSALNAAGESPMSTNLTLQAGRGPQFSSAPYRDETDPTSPVSLHLRWKLPEEMSGQDVIRYKILRDDGAYGDFVEVGTTTGLNETIGGLTNSLFYRFVVQAENTVGWGEFSPVFRTQVCGEPDPPDNIQFSDFRNDGLTITWDPPTNGGCNSPSITKYEIFMRQGNNAYIRVYEGAPSNLRFVLAGAMPAEDYSFYMRTYNWDQVSVISAVSTITIGAAPDPPATPTYTSGTKLNMVISWTEANSVLPVTAYRLFTDNSVAGPIGTEVTLASPTDLSVDHTSLTGDTNYRYQVQAQNANGWGGLSGVATLVTSLSPSAPLSVSYHSSIIRPSTYLKLWVRCWTWAIRLFIGTTSLFIGLNCLKTKGFNFNLAY